MSRCITIALSFALVAGLPGIAKSCAPASSVVIRSFVAQPVFVQSFAVQQFAVPIVQQVFAAPQVSVTDVRIRRGLLGRVRRVSTVNVNSFGGVGINSVRIGGFRGFGGVRVRG